MKPNPFTAREMFAERFQGSPNFMTPKRRSVGLCSPDVAYEVSYGRGLIGPRGEPPGTVWGLTFLAWNGREVVTLPARSTMCGTLADCKERVAATKRLLKLAPTVWSDWTAEHITWLAEQPKHGTVYR